MRIAGWTGVIAALAASVLGCGDDDASPLCLLDEPPSVENGTSGEDGRGYVPLVEGEDRPLIRGLQGGLHLWLNVRVRGVCLDDVRLERRAFDDESGELLYFTSQRIDFTRSSEVPTAGELPGSLTMILCPNLPDAQIYDRRIRLHSEIVDGEDTSRMATDDTVVTARCDPAAQGGAFYETCLELCAGRLLTVDAGRPDGGADAAADAGPDAGDPCDACTAPDHGFATCTAGTCGFTCEAGYAPSDTVCAPAPRLIAPTSGATTTARRLVARFEIPAGAGASRVEVCRDRACTDVVSSTDVAETDTSATIPVPAGVLYWRVIATLPSAVWQVHVPSRDALRDGAWGVSPDFELDGYGDVTVGAPAAATDAGRAYVHAGSSRGTPASSTITLSPPDGAGSSFGNALAVAGDLDGDGFPELAVGAPRAAAGAGRVHIWRGGPAGITAMPAWSLDSPDAPGALFGGAIAGAGDVNGDGFGDLLVASIGEGVTPGRLHVFHGGPRGPAGTPARSLTGPNRFASAIAGAMDLDGDGFADIAVGAPGNTAAAGEVQIYPGSAAGIGAMPALTLGAPSGGGQFGYAVAGAGDVDGDGYADLIAGAPSWDDGTTMAMDVGRAYLFRGGSGGIGTTPATSLGAVAGGGSYFGWSVAGLGDTSGDGYPEVAVGAFGVSSSSGRVYVHLGSATGLALIAATTIDSPFGGEGHFGWSVASAGDVDHNGLADLVVGAPRVDDDAGRAYLFRGTATGTTTTPLVTLIGAAGGSYGRALGHADR